MKLFGAFTLAQKCALFFLIFAAFSFSFSAIVTVSRGATNVETLEDLPKYKLFGATALGAELIANAAEVRTRILVSAIKKEFVISGASTCQVAAYYSCNVTKAHYPEDFLTPVWNLPAVKMTDEGMKRRKAIVEALQNARIVKLVAKSVVVASAAETPEKSLKLRESLASILAVGIEYLEDFDLEKEHAWKKVCDEGNVEHRFIQYGPGEYHPGVAPRPARYIEAFLYRRMVDDGMGRDQLRGIISAIIIAIIEAS